jgi:acyl CoA:acetate/3-ketoacid CoA transferase
MVVEGTTSDEEGNIRTYDNSILQSRLFVALQTALTRIEQLESRLAQLEGQS